MGPFVCYVPNFHCFLCVDIIGEEERCLFFFHRKGKGKNRGSPFSLRYMEKRIPLLSKIQSHTSVFFFSEIAYCNEEKSVRKEEKRKIKIHYGDLEVSCRFKGMPSWPKPSSSSVCLGSRVVLPVR